MTQKFNGRSVFIALRPNIFNLPHEHVTLEYLGHEPEWKTIQALSGKWMKQFSGLPVTIAVNGYANWASKDFYYDVALVEFKEYYELSLSKNWHITLERSRQPIEPRQYNKDADAFNYDYADKLWVGYTDENGAKKFIESYNARHLVRSFTDASG